MRERTGRTAGRVEWLDTAKGVGIILVVLAHALPKTHFLWIWINQFHMPLFFMISGYLYSTKPDWKRFAVRKMRTLWIPFVFTSTITRVISSILGNGSGWGVKSIIRMLLLLEAGPMLGAIWFLRVLLYALLLYDLMVRGAAKLFREKKEFVLSALAVLLLVVGIHTQLPAQGSVVLNSIAFIHLGQVLHNRKLLDRFHPIAAFSAIALSGAVSLANRTSYVNNTYTYPLAFIVAAVAGSIGLIGLCRCMPTAYGISEILEYIGKNSIGPMIWQFVSFKAVEGIQILFYHLEWNRISDFPVIYDYAYGFWIPLCVVAGLFGSVLLYQLINRPVDHLCVKGEHWLLSVIK